MTITGTYPNMTFNATGGGGKSSTISDVQRAIDPRNWDTGGTIESGHGLQIPGMPDHRLITAHVGERYTMPGRQESPGLASSTINVHDSLSGVRVAEQVRRELERMNSLGKLRLA